MHLQQCASGGLRRRSEKDKQAHKTATDRTDGNLYEEGEKKSKNKVTPRPTWLVSCVTRELNPTEKTASRKWGGGDGGLQNDGDAETKQRRNE